MDTYSYTTALSPGQIRLLQITPGNSNTPIEISLGVFELHDQADKFEAISYAWGSPDLTHEIIIHGKALKITASLHGALWQFREDKKHGRLWIDSICINQDDLDEKTIQVQKMADIYRAASLVIVWLGPDDGFAQAGLRVLRLCGEVLDHSGSGPKGTRVHNSISDWEQSGLPHSKSSDWRAVGKLVRRPWFGRTWILQEIAVAKNSEIRVGLVNADCQSIIRGMRNLFQAFWFAQALTAEEAIPLQEFTLGLSFALSSKPDSQDRLSLAAWLVLTRQFGCKDPRDRIFAILEFASPKLRSIVNYRLSLRDVVILAARTTLGGQTSSQIGVGDVLEVLLFLDDRDRSPDLPSWYPFNSSKGVFQPLTPAIVPGLTLSYGDVQSLSLDIKDRLELRGYCVDQVHAFVETPNYLKQQRAPQAFSADLISKAELAAQNLAVADQYLDLTRQTLSKSSKNDRQRIVDDMSIFVRCACLGGVVNPAGSVDEDVTDEILVRSWEALYMIWQMELAVTRSLQQSQPGDKDKNDQNDGSNNGNGDRVAEAIMASNATLRQLVYDKARAWARADALASESDSEIDSDSDPEPKSGSDQYTSPDDTFELDSELLSEALEYIVEDLLSTQQLVARKLALARGGRKFSATNNNRIGWIPDNAQSNDLIVYFTGWNCPFVLRPVPATSTSTSTFTTATSNSSSSTQNTLDIQNTPFVYQTQGLDPDQSYRLIGACYIQDLHSPLYSPSHLSASASASASASPSPSQSPSPSTYNTEHTQGHSRPTQEILFKLI